MGRRQGGAFFPGMAEFPMICNQRLETIENRSRRIDTYPAAESDPLSTRKTADANAAPYR
jgi:hypothetical protein